MGTTKYKAYSITTFCDVYNISRSTFYKLKQEGNVPEMHYASSKRPLISKEAAEIWLKSLPTGY